MITTSKSIMSEMYSLKDIFFDNKILYTIPYFQRDFVWGHSETAQLFEDFSEDTEGYSVDIDELDGYLLGSVVLISDEEGSFQVVDGQQRLTTISLVFKALDSIIGRKAEKAAEDKDKDGMWKWVELKADLKNGFGIYKGDYYHGLKIQHDSALNFGKYYQYLINDKDDIDALITNGSDANIKSVYDFLYTTLDSFDDEVLSKFVKYFKNKVKLIVTTASTEAKAFQLFEVLNERGKSLEPMDLIKNSFLKIIQTEGLTDLQREDFNENWKSFLGNLQKPKKKLAVASFMKYYLLARDGELIRNNILFSYLKKDRKVNGKSMKGKDILDFARDVNKFSSMYLELQEGNYSSFISSEKGQVYLHILLKILKIDQIHSLLMLVYDTNEDDKMIVLDLAVRFGASVIYSFTQTNFIEKTFPTLFTEFINEKDNKKRIDALTASLEKVIRERAGYAKTILPTKRFESTSGNVTDKALDLLKFIELYVNENPTVIKKHVDRSITAEHILSRNLGSPDFKALGFVDETDMKEHLNLIGNLTLLYNTQNSSIGNRIYSEKKETYKLSEFILTRTIIKPEETASKGGVEKAKIVKINKLEKQYTEDSTGNWNKSLIEKRGKDIAELMYAVLVK